MISAIAWVPSGVAALIPKRYELSTVERELVQMMDEQGDLDQVEQTLNEKLEKRSLKAKELSRLPPSEELPADLRMDEYSTDEDDDVGGVALGRLLVGNTESAVPAEMIPDNEEENSSDGGKLVKENVDIENEDGDENIDTNSDKSSIHSDDDDDHNMDIPDTREFMPVDVEGLQAMSFGGNAGFIGEFGEDEGDDDDSEREDIKLTPDDALVLVAKTDEEFATLEVNVYDQKTGNLFVHHDIPLPAYPLCLAHGELSAGGVTGNFCAVGSFDPGIEIWNLDVLNALEPSCILGGEDTSTADDLMKLQMLGSKTISERKVRGRPSLRSGSHTDAVMSLSWNQHHKQVLASGSADCTVKLWDVTRGGGDDDGSANASTFRHHKGKVQAVAWHPSEGTLLATGAYDRTVALVDARSKGDNLKRIKLSSDCEAIAWDPCQTELLTVVSEDGTLYCWDVRHFETSKPVWKLMANEFGGINDLSYNSHVPGLMATCSVQNTVSLWDTHKMDETKAGKIPRLCGTKDMCSGKLYSVAFYPSTPWLLGTGGAGNQLALWDISEEAAIRSRFKEREVMAVNIESANTPVIGNETKNEDLEAMLLPTIDVQSSKNDNNNETKKSSDKKRNKNKGKSKKRTHKKS